MRNIFDKFNRLKEWFALLSVTYQLTVVVFIGLIIVLLSALFLGSIENSYTLFMDPSSLPIVKQNTAFILFGFLLTLAGIILTGFVISVLSSSLETTLRDLRMGKLNFKGENHTLIVNYNPKITDILQELNNFYENKQKHEIVILLEEETLVEKLQEEIEKLSLHNIRIFVRYGNPLSMVRFEELSIGKIFSLIILSNDNIQDNFEKDNYNLQIVNTLCNDVKFLEYLQTKAHKTQPVKAVVELTQSQYLEKGVEKLSQGYIRAIAPQQVLNEILNLSIIDTSFYTIWLELLSFEGYEFYFTSLESLGVKEPTTFAKLFTQFQKGILVGVSALDENKQMVPVFNDANYPLTAQSWVIVLAKDISQIEVNQDKKIIPATTHIAQPKEIFTKDILVIGEDKDIVLQEYLDLKHSTIDTESPDLETLYTKEYYDTKIAQKNYNRIILNLEDKQLYRVAIALNYHYTQVELERFVFMLDDPIIAHHLQATGFKNTILSQLLVSKYIVQMSTQITLQKVYKEMLSKEGSEINLIPLSDLPTSSLASLQQLKTDLINSHITYLGIIDNEGNICFDSKNLGNARSIIVISKGDF